MTDPLVGATFVRREARIHPASIPHYPTVLSGWQPELLVTDGGETVWLETTMGRPIPIPVVCLERRVVEVP